MKTLPKVLYERRGQAPSPSKDYHQLKVTEDSVIFGTWRISLRKDSVGKSPTQNKLTYEDFYYDTQVSSAIRHIFGEDVLQYVEGLVHGDWIIRMDRPILNRIILYLDLADVFRLSLVCRHFRSVCSSNKLWRQIYELNCVNVTPEMWTLGEERGWKKMFFTNKLQIRKEVSRLRRSEAEKEKELKMRKSISKSKLHDSHALATLLKSI